MKKLTALLSVLLALCLLCSSTVFAQTAESFEPQTAVLDVDSVELSDLAEKDDYVLTDGNVPVLIVAHHTEVPGAATALKGETDNGYYTAEFAMPDTTKKVFLTGLTRDNVAEIEAAVTAGYSEGEDFELVDLGFIDTEKTYDEDDDDELCWAAATANILAYTGWGAQAGFEDEDDLFELLISNFENKGGSTYYGLEWFFDGMDDPYISYGSSTFPRVVNYPNSGAYLPDYTFDTFTDTIKLEELGAAGFAELLRQLRAGRGAELGLDLYKNGSYSNGHAVTCWGMVTDTEYPEDDKAHYDSILITDSDTGELDSERRNARDVMDVNTLTPYDDDNFDTYCFDIGGGYTAFISDSVTLMPYSADAQKETSGDATRNRRTDPDIVLSKISVSTDSEDKESEMKVIPSGSPVYFDPYFPNESDVDYSGAFKINYTLTDSRGAVIVSSSLNFGNTSLPCHYDIYLPNPQRLSTGLSAGIYTLTVEANPSHSVAEAYWFNNTRTVTFAVGDAYVLGDVDDDDDVSSVDSALILRNCAGFSVGLDSRASVRGDVNSDGDMDVVDSTYIQRYLSDMTVTFPINSAVLYS